ncbi:MAG: AAA family ATPase [Legionellaceae bacterium]|nr:AAA family ATPase [Legionellaceae bacterium]
MRIPTQFYYTTTTRGEGFAWESQGEGFDVDRFAEGASDFWIDPEKKERKQKKLLLADWRLRSWTEEQIEALQLSLKTLLSENFSLFIEQNGTIEPLLASHLPILKNRAVLKAMGLSAPEYLTQQAYAQQRITKDELFILNDYWVDGLVSNKFKEQNERRLNVTDYHSLSMDEREKLKKIIPMTHGLQIILSTFEVDAIRTFNELKTKATNCEFILQFKEASFNEHNLNDLLAGNEIHCLGIEFRRDNLQSIEKVVIQDPLTFDTLVRFYKLTPNLKALYLNDLTNIPTDLPFSTNRLEQIEELGIASFLMCNQITWLLSKTPQLKKLTIVEYEGALLTNSNAFPPFEALCFTFGESHLVGPQLLLYVSPFLKRLSLSGDINIVDISIFKHLEVLDLKNGRIKKALANSLLESTPTLRSLYLSSTTYRDLNECFLVRTSLAPSEMNYNNQNQAPVYLLFDKKLYFTAYNSLNNSVDLITLSVSDIEWLDSLFPKNPDEYSYASQDALKEIANRTGHYPLGWKLTQLGFPNDFAVYVNSAIYFPVSEQIGPLIPIASNTASTKKIRSSLTTPQAQIDGGKYVKDSETRIIQKRVSTKPFFIAKATPNPDRKKHNLLAEQSPVGKSKLKLASPETNIQDTTNTSQQPPTTHSLVTQATRQSDTIKQPAMEQPEPQLGIVDDEFSIFEYSFTNKFTKKLTPGDMIFKYQPMSQLSTGMIVNKFCQYLMLIQEEQFNIPKLQNGICSALSHYFLSQHTDEWRTFLKSILKWNGQKQTLDYSLKNYLEKLRFYIRTYQINPSHQSRVYLGDKDNIFTLYLDHIPPEQGCVLANPWHMIAIRRRASGDWELYNSYWDVGHNGDYVKVVQQGQIISELRKELGPVILGLSPNFPIPTPKVTHPQQFLAKGGLFLHCQHVKHIFRQLTKDSALIDFSPKDLKGLLIRTNAGIPAWLIGIKDPDKASFTRLVLQQFIQKNPNTYYELLENSMEEVTPFQKFEYIIAIIQEFKDDPEHRDPLIRLVRDSSDTNYYETRLKSWYKARPNSYDTTLYCQRLTTITRKNNLVELPSTTAIQGLRFALEKYAKDTHRPIFYAHSPHDLVIAKHVIERKGDIGRIQNGPAVFGGPLYKFLQSVTPLKNTNQLPKHEKGHERKKLQTPFKPHAWQYSTKKEIVISPIEQQGHICKPTAIAAIEGYYARIFGFPAIPLRKHKKHALSIRQIAKNHGSFQGELLEVRQVQHVLRDIGYETNLIDVTLNKSLFQDAILHHLSVGDLLLICFAVDRSTGLPTSGYDYIRSNEHAAVITGFDANENTVTIVHWNRQYTTSFDELYHSCMALQDERKPEYYERNDLHDWDSAYPKYELCPPPSNNHTNVLIPKEGSGFRGKLLAVKQPTPADVHAWQKGSLVNRIQTIEDRKNNYNERSQDISLTPEENRTIQTQSLNHMSYQKNSNPVDNNNAPILLINYEQFSASDIARLNTMIDNQRTVGNVAIPENIVLIGLINRNNPDCYQGSDFYGRFANAVETCPIDESVLQAAIPQLPIVDKLLDNKPIQINATIHLYHASNWKARLLGRWIINNEHLIYQQGALVPALAKGPNIILENAPWDDPEFVLFWQTAIARGSIIHEGHTILIPKNLNLIKQTGYDWEKLTSYVVDQPVLNRASEILNPNLLPSFFGRYDCKNGLLNYQAGLVELSENNSLNVYVTRSLSEDEWAMLLAECQQHQVTLHVICAPNVTLPHTSVNKMPVTSLTYRQFTVASAQVIISTDIDTTVTTQTQNQSDWEVIDVSELSPADLLFRLVREKHPPLVSFFNFLDPIATLLCSLVERNDESLFHFKAVYGLIPTALANNKKLILKGRFSDKLIDNLAPLLIDRQHKLSNSKLVIITDDPKAFQYMSQIYIHTVTAEEKLACLKLPSNSPHIAALQPLMTKPLGTLRSLCHFWDRNPNRSAGENWAGMYTQFSGQQPIKPLDPNHSALESRQFQTNRMDSVNNVLATEPYVFLSGLSGVGKSTFVRKIFSKKPNTTVFTGKETIEAWAKSDTGHNVLFLDEVTLDKSNWTTFEGLYDNPPWIVVNATYYKLTSQHKVIFAGNPVSYGNDRVLASLFERHGNAVWFEMLPEAVLYEEILKPLISSTVRNGPGKKALVLTLSQHFLAIYRFLAIRSTTDVLISPRQLEMMALLTFAHFQNPRANPEDVAKYYAFQIAKPLVPNDHMQAFLAEFQPTIPLEHFSPFTTAEFIITPSRQRIVSQIEDILALQQLRKKISQQHKPPSEADKLVLYGGLGQFVLTGDPGVGKTELVIETLAAHGYAEEHNLAEPTTKSKPFYCLPVTLSYSKKEAILLKAFHEGAIVVIDEVNSADMMESLLNDLLMGIDPNGNRPQKPGFFILGTQNPPTMAGRRIASTAQLMRSMTETCVLYPENELIEILIQKGLQVGKATRLVAAFQKQVAYATNNQLSPIPSFRDLLSLVNEIVAHQQQVQTILDTQLSFFHTTTKRNPSPKTVVDIDNEKLFKKQ